MKRSKVNIEMISVVLGLVSTIALIAAFWGAFFGSSIVAITGVVITSVAAITAAVLESFRLTK